MCRAASRARCTRAPAARSRGSLDGDRRGAPLAPSGGGAPRASRLEDDPARLKAERDAADRAYNDALTALDRAIQQLPADFPHPPPIPDERQITPLNTLWKIDQPPTSRRRLRGRFADAGRRVVAPLFV